MKAPHGESVRRTVRRTIPTFAEPGTLGELSPKLHPWLYAETARVGLGISFKECHSSLAVVEKCHATVVFLQPFYCK